MFSRVQNFAFHRMGFGTLSVMVLFWLLTPLSHAAEENPAISRASAYLQQESALWPRENDCFSCHNNGDAARAVLLASPNGRPLKNVLDPIAVDWFQQPERWTKTGPVDGDFDPSLALIQFGATLEIARKRDLLHPSRKARGQLGAFLTKAQHPEGYWPIEAPHQVGSPGTYGNVLATAMASQVLISLGNADTQVALEKSRNWIHSQELKATVDLAGGIKILRHDSSPRAQAMVQQWTTALISGQNPDGSWGPYPQQFGEVFDTAIALISLTEQTNSVAAHRPHLVRGQSFLTKHQEPEGGWPETTRPPGSISYAQHISTSAWALIALTHLERALKPKP